MIFRTKKTRNFTTISNDFLQDPRLSLKAKGLLAYMLTKPDHWIFSEQRLTKAFEIKEGRRAIRFALRELEDAGYLVRTGEMESDANGRWLHAEYYIYEISLTPKPEPPWRKGRKSVQDEPHTETASARNRTPKTQDEWFEEIMRRAEFDFWLSGRSTAGQQKIIQKCMMIVAGICAAPRDRPITVNRQKLTCGGVAKRLLTLNAGQYAAVVDRIQSTEAEIDNREGYLITALYNEAVR